MEFDCLPLKRSVGKSGKTGKGGLRWILKVKLWLMMTKTVVFFIICEITAIGNLFLRFIWQIFANIFNYSRKFTLLFKICEIDFVQTNR